MSTAAQIDANRENSKLSTGPRSEQGKATSSRNNTRHGLAAQGFVVLPDRESAFEQLEQGLQRQLVPFGTLQETIFKRVLECSWNLHRCRLAEAQLYINSDNPEIDPLNDEQNAAKYARIHKYTRQNENGLLKSLRLLGKLQTEDQFRHECFPISQEELEDPETFDKSPHSLSAACDFEKVVASKTNQQKSEACIQRKNLKARTDAVIAEIHALGNPNFQLEADLADESDEPQTNEPIATPVAA